jgi:hypothetical protein
MGFHSLRLNSLLRPSIRFDNHSLRCRIGTKYILPNQSKNLTDFSLSTHQLTFEKSSHCECPTKTAILLIFDYGYSIEFSPIEAQSRSCQDSRTGCLEQSLFDVFLDHF